MTQPAARARTSSRPAPARAADAPTDAPAGVRDPADAPDPQWWAAPLTGSLGAPLLLLLSGSTVDLFTGAPAIVALGFLLPLALALPGWFLARTRRRRPTRIVLAALACLVAATYPALLITFGTGYFFVMLVTGHVTL
ncbi:hypothetical protein [Streptomyces sp. NPDC003327]